MPAWHVIPHLLSTIQHGRNFPIIETNLYETTCLGRLRTRGTSGLVVDAEDNVEELNQGALSITSTTVLLPLALTIAFVVEDTSWQTGCSHAFAAGQEWPDFVIEDLGIAVLSHSAEKGTKFRDTLRDSM